jgi:hypothetical protein
MFPIVGKSSISNFLVFETATDLHLPEQASTSLTDPLLCVSETESCKTEFTIVLWGQTHFKGN